MPNVVSISVVANVRSAQDSLRALELQWERLKRGPLGGGVPAIRRKVQ